MSIRHPAFIALVAALPTPALAESDFQQWLGLAVRINLTDTLSLQNESQARWSGDRDGLYQFQHSALLAYRAAPNVTVAAGYLHSPNYNGGKFASMERRAREQVTVDNIVKLGPAALSARLRTEQRWRDDLVGTAWRVRPYVRLSLPLGDKADPTLHLSEEVFVNLNTTAFQTVQGIERLRTTASLAFPISKTVRLDAGYLNQHRIISGEEDRGEHALTASLSFSF